MNHDNGAPLVPYAPPGGVESEDDWQEYLAGRLSDAGWYVKREVTPAEDNKRADILAKNSQVGDEWIGIECKKWKYGDNASRALHAVNQIMENYRHKHWPNEKIRLWAIAPYIYESFEDTPTGEKSRYAERVLCDMVNFLGVGYLQHHDEYATIPFHGGSRGWLAATPAFGIERDPFDGYTHPQDLKEEAERCTARQPGEKIGGRLSLEDRESMVND